MSGGLRTTLLAGEPGAEGRETDTAGAVDELSWRAMSVCRSNERLQRAPVSTFYTFTSSFVFIACVRQGAAKVASWNNVKAQLWHSNVVPAVRAGL